MFKGTPERHVAQPPTQSRVSYEVRPGHSGHWLIHLPLGFLLHALMSLGFAWKQKDLHLAKKKCPQPLKYQWIQSTDYQDWINSKRLPSTNSSDFQSALLKQWINWALVVDSLNSVNLLSTSGHAIASLEHVGLYSLHRNTLTSKVYLLPGKTHQQ